MQKAYILTECGQHIGYGHLMRCMPLYDELVLSGFDVQFLLNGDVNETLMKGAGRDYHYEIMNWLTISYAFLQHSICLVDSYLADVSQYQAIAAAAQTLIVIDDNDRLPYQHAVVVNPSLFGDTLGYTRDATCHYLLGKRYIILRDAFRHRYEKKNRISNSHLHRHHGRHGCVAVDPYHRDHAVPTVSVMEGKRHNRTTVCRPFCASHVFIKPDRHADGRLLFTK